MDPLSLSASITALLQLTSSVIQYLNGVRGASEDRGRILSELASVNSILFILQDQADQAKHGDQWASTLQSLNLSNGPLEQFGNALESLSAKLAPPATSLKKLGKAIVWPFQKEEVQEILGSIERQKALLTLARQNDHIKLSKAIKDDIALMRDEVEEVRRGVSGIQMSQMTSEHLKIIEWLDAPDPWTNYNKALKDRNPKTGLWFIGSSAYEDWKSTKKSFLWLHGIPGCGKTILNSTILQNVLDQHHTKPNSAVLFFYFDFNDTAKQRHEKMIRSLICQLFNDSDMPVLKDLYSSCFDGSRQPTIEELLSTLRQMMASMRDTYIILDALDECTERGELFVDLEQIMDWNDANSHVLTTSRREMDIEEALTPLGDLRLKIDIQSTNISADIRTYIHDRLQADRRLKRWQKDPKTQLEIEDTLLGKAHGMFRWVACQLDILGNCFSVHHLRQALASLPKTLDDTYARILCTIDEQYNHCNRDILKILQWLTFSARPLRLEEVAEILAIDVDQTPRFDPERRWPEPRDILRMCSSLITLTMHSSDASVQYEFSEDSQDPDTYSVAEGIDAQDPITYVGLAHFSVKEYLVSDRVPQGMASHYSIREIESHGVLAEDCVAYLLQFDEPDSLTSESLALSPLAHYAAKFWVTHAKHAERGPIKSTTLLSFELLMSDRGGLLNWIRIDNPDHGWGEELNLGLEDLASPLYYASQAGLFEQVKLLIERGMDVNVPGGIHGNALQMASFLGYKDIVQVLLDNGADVNIRGGRFSNALQAALQAASFQGHFDIIQDLLKNIIQGLLKNIIQGLFKNGADINAQWGDFGNALQAAFINSDYTDVICLLIDNGADVNMQGEAYDSALVAACRIGSETAVKVLLDRNADVNVLGGNSRKNALQLASEKGYENIVMMLLNKGANVDTQAGSSGCSALQLASENGYENVVKMLLDQGADVNDDNDKIWGSGSALQLASEKGYENIVMILLNKGANVDTQAGRSRRSALQLASEKGYENIVMMLLDKGADVNGCDDKIWVSGSALQLASRNGYENVVKMLLDQGADVNGDNDKIWSYGSALQLASEKGYENIVMMLLNKGVNVDT